MAYGEDDLLPIECIMQKSIRPKKPYVNLVSREGGFGLNKKNILESDS
jgi:hypothetical protein